MQNYGVCISCNNIITKNKFENYENNRDNTCLKCNQKSKEKIKERKKLYNEKNKEKIKEQKKLYREKNKEKIREQQKLYNEKNKEKIKEQKETQQKQASKPQF